MELVRFPLRGGFSVQSIFTFVLAVVITAILWAILSVSTAGAQATTATWSGTETILFDNHGYNAATDVNDTTSTIPSGATVYKAPLQTSGNGSSSQKLLVLFFAPGVDPPTATTVKYVEFDYDNGTLSSPTTPRDITLTIQGEADPVGSSCSVSGIGWVICPVSVWIAEGMDWLFERLAELIKVQPPVLGDPNDSMYAAWSIMRTVANVAFVIVFLIIIYSQLTNIAVSNYGLKKLIPRLIIAALLVNLSFFITALAIDISNVLGYAVQDVFNAIREQVFQVTNDDLTGVNSDGGWAALTAIVLAGGGYFGVSYIVTSGATIFLVPILLGLALTLMFVFLILAARQAIILILVIIAPLAFVAYLLPNTEKWFEKWKDIFLTMLIFFPAFSLVFGGSQLAGQIIIQNAGDNIVMLIFGMAVQIAPLVITPLILKLSGGLLGKIAQLANDPRKGLMDRTKGWAGERAEITRRKTLAKPPITTGKFKRTRSALRPGSGVRFVENNRRSRKALTDLYGQKSDNVWHDSKRYEKIHIRMFEAEVDKQIIDNRSKDHIQKEINKTNSRFNIQNAQLEAGKRVLDQTVKITEADVKEYAAGRVPTGANTELQAAIGQIQAAQQATSVEGLRSSNADSQVQREFAEALKNSAALRQRAGGIKQLGADSVLSSAVSAVRQADAADIKNIQEASDLAPGDLAGAAREMEAAIAAGNSIRARAFQNMLVTAGGAGMDQFRKTMISIGTAVPTDVSEQMRDNLLSNHGALKAKSNDLIDWAAKGGILESHTTNPTAWSGLSDKDFIMQHPKSQVYALDVNAFDRARAQSILAADVIEGNVLTEAVKARLRNIR